MCAYAGKSGIGVEEPVQRSLVVNLKRLKLLGNIPRLELELLSSISALTLLVE